MLTIAHQSLYTEKPKAAAGMFIEGDLWGHAHSLIQGDELDLQYFGTSLRYHVGEKGDPIESLPVIVTLTGNMVYIDQGARKMRAKLTTWNSNDEPVSFSGWLWL